MNHPFIRRYKIKILKLYTYICLHMRPASLLVVKIKSLVQKSLKPTSLDSQKMISIYVCNSPLFQHNASLFSSYSLPCKYSNCTSLNSTDYAFLFWESLKHWTTCILDKRDCLKEGNVSTGIGVAGKHSLCPIIRISADLFPCCFKGYWVFYRYCNSFQVRQVRKFCWKTIQ
jgi:hypothetical protein